MVDFSKLVGKKGGTRPIDPLEVFKGLDRKASHILLRGPQQEVLQMLHASRQEPDQVLKMPTGTGKSTVGLLYLVSHMNEATRPVVYLCPTVQLVEQVLAEAGRLGVEAHPYPRGEPHPNPRCLTAQAVIVCTYDKLFNAKTTFNRPDVGITPAAIVLDDAHSGVEEVRNTFTLHFEAGSPVHGKVFALLSGPASAYASTSTWADIKKGRADAVIELPYWSWREIVADVESVLAEHANDESLLFRWANIRDALRWCRCVVSGAGVEIVPIVPLVDRVRPFAEASHRLFMSATLADDSVLVRELGCAAKAANSPIAPTTGGGMGERMVLAPSLLTKALDRDWVLQWGPTIAKKYSVVVLCSSAQQLVDWVSVGAKAAMGDDVASLVNDLKAGTRKFAAVAQRFDGIDLPDDACRVLVLDGIPFGDGIADRYDSATPSLPGGVRNRTLNRIEQGLGRAIRSNADYAVCVLAGPEIASFITRTEVQERMSPDVRIQLRLAKELAELATDDPTTDPEAAFDDLVRKCLSRDPGWKAFYDDRVRKEVAAVVAAKPDEQQIRLAAAMRDAVFTAASGDANGAYASLNAKVSPAKLEDPEKAQYLQVLANLASESDPAEAVTLQKAAFAKSKKVFRPPPGAALRPMDPGDVDAAANVLKVYSQYTNGNGLVAEFQVLKGFLVFGSSAHHFEDELQRLFAIIGADSSQPEKEWGAGPDNLALWPKLSLVIEAKNEAKYTEVPKADAEQLLHSVEWFKKAYPARTPTPIFVGPTDRAGKNIHPPPGTRVMTPKLLESLVLAVDGFVAKLAGKPAPMWSAKELHQLLSSHALAPDAFVKKYTTSCR